MVVLGMIYEVPANVLSGKAAQLTLFAQLNLKPIKTMNESQIIELGWRLVKKYKHDQYHTNRYRIGCMEVEFTYEGEELLSCDVSISELNCMPISFEQAKLLTEMLGHWQL